MHTACVYEYSPDIKVEVVCLYSVDVVFQETFDGNALISEMSFKRDSTVYPSKGFGSIQMQIRSIRQGFEVF